MNTISPGDKGKASAVEEDLACQHTSVKRELDEAREFIARLTVECDNARRQCAQHTQELSMARSREDALHGRIRQLEGTVKSLQSGAAVAGIVGFGVALLMKKGR